MTDVVVESLTHPSRFILEHGDHRQVVLVRRNAVAICYVLHLYVIIIKNTYVIIYYDVRMLRSLSLPCPRDDSTRR